MNFDYTCAHCQGRQFYIRAVGEPARLEIECVDCHSCGELFPPGSAREAAREVVRQRDAGAVEFPL